MAAPFANDVQLLLLNQVTSTKLGATVSLLAYMQWTGECREVQDQPST